MCETGGMRTQVAVIARELAEPRVTNLPSIVSELETDLRGRVDGAKGLVEVSLDVGRRRLVGQMVQSPRSEFRAHTVPTIKWPRRALDACIVQGL